MGNMIDPAYKVTTSAIGEDHLTFVRELILSRGHAQNRFNDSCLIIGGSGFSRVVDHTFCKVIDDCLGDEEACKNDK